MYVMCILPVLGQISLLYIIYIMCINFVYTSPLHTGGMGDTVYSIPIK